MCGYEAIFIEIGFRLSWCNLSPIKSCTKIFIAFKVAPTETGVVRDARAVYDWVAARWPFQKPLFGASPRLGTTHDADSRAKGQLIVWGHSLGTAVSSHLVEIKPQLVVQDDPKKFKIKIKMWGKSRSLFLQPRLPTSANKVIIHRALFWRRLSTTSSTRCATTWWAWRPWLNQ